jgi:tripartite-type tricarboxylate transporter receptor subunit TctC
MNPLVRCLVAVALVFLFAPLAGAQAWPAKPIRLIVSFPPGSGPDAIARIYAPRLGEALGQAVVIENRAGAAGNIGLDLVAKSAADGYTLLNAPGSLIVINPHVYKLGVDVAKDLDPVAPTVRNLQFVLVRPGLPAHSLSELIAYGRSNPGKLNFGSPGSGSALHIGAVMLLRAAKIQATHVPYKGSPQVLADLIGERIDFMFDPGVAVPQIKAGKVRLLAVANLTRSQIFPDIPTTAEAGMDVNMGIVSGVFAPAGIPRDIAAHLNRELGRVLQIAELRAALAAIACDVVTASPVVREANIQAD